MPWNSQGVLCVEHRMPNMTLNRVFSHHDYVGLVLEIAGELWRFQQQQVLGSAPDLDLVVAGVKVLQGSAAADSGGQRCQPVVRDIEKAELGE